MNNLNNLYKFNNESINSRLIYITMVQKKCSKDDAIKILQEYKYKKYQINLNNIPKPNLNNIPKPNLNNIQKPNLNNIQKPKLNNIPKPKLNNIPKPKLDNTVSKPKLDNTVSINFDNISQKLKIYINNTKYKALEKRICIILHLFNTLLIDEFITYIDNVVDYFKNITIIITINDKEDTSSLQKFLKKKYKNIRILHVENKGVDIGGLFKSLKYIRKNNLEFDYILKIHTKTSDEKWRKGLIEPLVNKDNLNIINRLFSLNNIGFIATENYIIKNDNSDYENTNKIGLEKFCNKYNIKNGYNFNYFVAGTMFWIKYNVLNKLSNDMIEYLYNMFSYLKPIPNNLSDKIHGEYIAERIISGVLCNNYVNIKINNNNFFDICDMSNVNSQLIVDN